MIKFDKSKAIFILQITIISILVIIVLLRLGGSDESSDTSDAEEIYVEPEFSEFGFSLESLIEIKSQVERNETLSTILNSFNVPYALINNLVEASKGVFDVRHIAAGKKYHAFISNDTTETLKYFVYERSHVSYVVFQLNDSLCVYEGKREITTETRSFAGIINNSLYSTLISQNASPALAMRLSEVYAWQIDFFRIQKGDKFKVIYEEEFVNGKSIGVGDIKAAYFSHFNEDYYAIYFDQDETGEYFDEKGKGLRKAFLKAPLEFSRISSRYSLNRLHPVHKVNRPHLGTDYAAPTGTPIRTVGDGVVLEAGYKGNNGNYVRIKHNSVYTTGYLHMSRIAKGIRSGVRVKQGQVIGYVGSTGLATGPHLCYRFWKNGQQVDPLREKMPPSDPVKKEYENEFFAIRDSLVTLLNQIDFKSAEDEQIIASSDKTLQTDLKKL